MKSVAPVYMLHGPVLYANQEVLSAELMLQGLITPVNADILVGAIISSPVNLMNPISLY